MSLTYMLERSGEFAVADSALQCGNGTQILTYKVVIHGGPRDLNENGWLLDNRAIPQYFTDKYSRSGEKEQRSCEQIARDACIDFAALVAEAGGKARHVTVSVSGIAGSMITADWWRGPFDDVSEVIV